MIYKQQSLGNSQVYQNADKMELLLLLVVTLLVMLMLKLWGLPPRGAVPEAGFLTQEGLMKMLDSVTAKVVARHVVQGLLETSHNMCDDDPGRNAGKPVQQMFLSEQDGIPRRSSLSGKSKSHNSKHQE